MSPSDLTPVQILALADAHIEHFDKLIALSKTKMSVRKTVNVGDCRHYKSVWGSIRAKGGVWQNLSRQERGEVHDAVESGDYSELLGAA